MYSAVGLCVGWGQEGLVLVDISTCARCFVLTFVQHVKCLHLTTADDLNSVQHVLTYGFMYIYADRHIYVKIHDSISLALSLFVCANVWMCLTTISNTWRITH